MSRIRSIHPGFFTDDRLVATSMPARLLFIGLGVEADDKGVFEWKPLTLKMRVFPADNVDVPSLLEELVAADAIRFYEIEGRQYGAIRNFRKFQKPKTPNDIHPMDDDFRIYVGLPAKASEIPPGKPAPFPPKGEKSPQMEDGGGKREEKNEPIGSSGEPPKIAPVDARAVLFSEGLTALSIMTGKPPDKCRSVMGKWLKATGDDARKVHIAIDQAAENRVADPIPWIERTLVPVNENAKFADKNGNLPGDPYYGVDY